MIKEHGLYRTRQKPYVRQSKLNLHNLYNPTFIVHHSTKEKEKARVFYDRKNEFCDLNRFLSFDSNFIS